MGAVLFACAPKIPATDARLIDESDASLRTGTDEGNADETGRSPRGVAPSSNTRSEALYLPFEQVQPMVGAPTRAEARTKGVDIAVTNSSILGCATKILNDFLYVECEREESVGEALELAALRGVLVERWVEGSKVGFIASLKEHETVSVALGWSNDARVLRVESKSEESSGAAGELLSAESLYVMSPPDGSPDLQLIAFEHGDSKVDFALHFKKDGACAARTIQGELLLSPPSPYGTETEEFEEEMEVVDQMDSPASPIHLRFAQDRAFTRVSEVYVEDAPPPGLDKDCWLWESPILQSRLWPLRPGDSPGGQAIEGGDLPSPDDFDAAHPRTLVTRGADQNACQVRRVGDFVRVRCKEELARGSALGSWFYAGQVVQQKLNGGKLELLVRLDEDGTASGELVWEKGSLALELVGNSVPSPSGSLEESPYAFYRSQKAKSDTVVRAKTWFQAENAALEHPQELRLAYASPEMGAATFQLLAEGECPRRLSAVASFGWEQESDYAPVWAAPKTARRYFANSGTLAIDEKRGALWFVDSKTAPPPGGGEGCKLAALGMFTRASVKDLIQVTPAPPAASQEGSSPAAEEKP